MAKDKPEMTVQDHYMGMLKVSLEFAASVIQQATVALISDPSSHNKTNMRRVADKFKQMNANYVGHINQASKAMEEQFAPKE